MSNFSTVEANLEVNDEITSDERFILHLDIDYFFAQVEILKNPDLKDKPVIVGHERARETKRGVVLTCNYIVRKFGVHSGMPMKTALELCPDAIIVKSSYSDYKKVSNKIMSYLKKMNTPMRKAGIDEAYLDVTPHVENYEDAKELAISIKHDILQMTGLTVSIGVGPTLKIAKIGSDYNKPNGISVFPPKSLDKLFNDLPLTKIPGIGSKTASYLKEKGFTTADQLRRLDEQEVRVLLGQNGLYYYKILHAKSTNKILPRGDRKSVSHSRTFVGDPGDIETSIEMMNKLFMKSYNTLKKENFMTKTVTTRIRFNDFETITRSQSCNIHTLDKDRLLQITNSLIKPHLNDERGIRLLGVGFSNLKKIDDKQTSLDKFFQNLNSSHSLDLESGKYTVVNLLKSTKSQNTNSSNTVKKKKDMNLSNFF